MDEIYSRACCTCATLLLNVTPIYDEKTEKPLGSDRRLECCNRIICGNCIYKNPRFATYCPFCQISTAPSSLPQGLRDPPAYTPSSSTQSPPNKDPPDYSEELPSYSSLAQLSTRSSLPEKLQLQPANDVLHFLDHENDTLTSLSLRYRVPISELRRANGITSDHLLLGRRTIIIPGSHYKGGVSLSPRPVEGEEEERRKGTIRRWMVACKVSDYDIALLYLEQFDYSLESAIQAYRDDERWEIEHPLVGSIKGKGVKRPDGGRRRFLGQR
ncbi:hypothetical protein F5884DRAFT_195732 [Xylogone sp. PMI_703]|nr:hypothetical protein F5884DRAFT_195732 [Xylogone sp. PMI_703]